MRAPTGVWDHLLDDETRGLLARRPTRPGPGRRPAIIAVDLYDLVYDGGPKPVLDLMANYPASCGEYAWRALPATVQLYETARVHGVPIIHVTYDTRAETSPKPMHPTNRKRRQPDLNLYRLKAELANTPGELVIYKKRASAFFGTPTCAFLNEMGVDSLIVVGESTSGCVRSSVVEAASYGYPVSVVADCVFDRYLLNHQVSLLDMHLKYANVVDLASTLQWIRARPALAKAG